MVMILRSALEINKCINQNRQKMYELAKNMGISHPSVILISQQLDREILEMQQIMKKIR